MKQLITALLPFVCISLPAIFISLPAVFISLPAVFISLPALAQDSISFTQAQVDAGRGAYRDTCQICHGSSLANGQFGTPLRGSFFREKWKGKSVGELQQFMFEKMPPDQVMSLSPEQSAALLAFILARNDLMPGTAPLSGDYKSQMDLLLPW